MRRTLFVLIAALLLASCSDKEVRPPSEDSLLATEAFDLAHRIFTAYTSLDLPALKANTTDNGFSEMQAVLRNFDKVDVTYSPRWVEIEDGAVYLNISWKGNWTAGGKVTEERGMAVFKMVGKPLKLDSVPSGNPFVNPR